MDPSSLTAKNCHTATDHIAGAIQYLKYLINSKVTCLKSTSFEEATLNSDLAILNPATLRPGDVHVKYTALGDAFVVSVRFGHLDPLGSN